MEIITSSDKHTSSEQALEALEKIVDGNTLLLLSGGTSPDELYRLMAKDAKIKPSAVAMIDERYGEKMHANSNEKMLAESGLVEFFPILQEGLNLEQAASEYEKTLRELFAKYPKKVAVMGIGVDGHTAGIKPGLEYDHTKWVIGYDDANGSFGKRVTTTFECLEQIDQFIVLAFGEEKRFVIQTGFYTKLKKPVTIFTDISI